MKRGVILLGVLLLFLIFAYPLVIAQDDNSTDSDITIVDEPNLDSDSAKVAQAYDCLDSKIDTLGCSKLSDEEKAFSLLATGKCKSELTSAASNDECWPAGGCKIKQTAQAVYALAESYSDTNSAEAWLEEKTIVPSDVNWYLQIESTEVTSCTITYDSVPYSISIGADKKISIGAGSCLSLSEGSWWLRINPSCYDNEFEIKCDEDFLTNLLYKKQTASTIYVSDKTQQASAEATNIEHVNSKCFSTGTTCDYEGSLWATLAFKKVGKDISPYVPYLVTMADDNSEFLPEAFLYFFTIYSDIKTDLLEKQQGNKYWDESGDKFYDTALALFPFQYDEPGEKTNAKEWLLEDGVQDKDGCWAGHTRNTAFILYSIWPRDSVNPSPDPDCEDSGFYCISDIDCSTGDTLPGFNCHAVYTCCAEDVLLDSCDDLNGEICESDKICSRSEILTLEGDCCTGNCEEPPVESDCEIEGGSCEVSCFDSEEEIYESCPSSGEICCRTKDVPPTGSYWWVWILVILIILVILGIVFRDKLRPLWFRVKSKFSKGGRYPPGGRRPGGPRRPPSMLPPQSRRPVQRRIMPPASSHPSARFSPKPKGELDDVLNKLKSMGK